MASHKVLLDAFDLLLIRKLEEIKAGVQKGYYYKVGSQVDRLIKMIKKNKAGATEIVNPPKQGTPTVCTMSNCQKRLTDPETFGDLQSPLCWDCHSSLSDKAQDNFR